MKIVVAITGASGVIIGFRLLEELAQKGRSVYGIISENAKAIITHELGENFKYPSQIIYYNDNNIMAPLNSSSFKLDAMIVAPCSMKTLAAIATGYSHTLITRTAENIIRTNSKFILIPRETPLSATALKNMLHLRREGAIIFPPAVAYYHQPKSIDDITNFFVGKILDLLDIENDLYQRWE
jgi:4-hydroxy-3-polyprenylbenzoate decarboxylase